MCLFSCGFQVLVSRGGLFNSPQCAEARRSIIARIDCADIMARRHQKPFSIMSANQCVAIRVANLPKAIKTELPSLANNFERTFISELNEINICANTQML